MRIVRETLHACERNAPVSVKEKCTTSIYVYTSDQAWMRIWVCVCVSVIIKNQISSRQLLMCVCNLSTPGRGKKRRRPRCMCVCAGEIKHVHSPVDRYLCVNVCICMLKQVSDCDYIRQLHYCQVLCIKNSLVFSYNYKMQPCQEVVCQ